LQKPSEEPQAAVAILHASEPEESILLIRRATNPKDPWSGHWSFPGGHRESSDADLLDTALRELEEECAVRLQRTDLAEKLQPMQAGRRVGRVVCVAPFVFRIERVLPVSLDPTEAVEAAWTPVNVIADLTRHRLCTIPGLAEEFPGIDLNGTPLWGFTYRVLCQWIGVDAPK